MLVELSSCVMPAVDVSHNRACIGGDGHAGLRGLERHGYVVVERRAHRNRDAFHRRLGEAVGDGDERVFARRHSVKRIRALGRHGESRGGSRWKDCSA